MKSVPSTTAIAAALLALVVFTAPTQAQSEDRNSSLVKVSTYLASSKLPAGQPLEVLVVVQVQPGWHINANPASPDYLIPTEFKVVSQEGTKLNQPKYPKSSKLQMEGLDEPVHVYEGEVAIFGTMTAPAEAAGKTESLEMQLHYQACNNQKCLAPNKVIIKGKIPVAAAGETLEPLNEKIFEKYRPKPPQKPN